MTEHADARDDARQRGARTKVERTRAALLNAAASNFRGKGWLGSRVEDIARDAGVSAATAYNHFPTKHALIGCVFGPFVRPSVDRALDRLAADDPAAEVLEDHVRELCAVVREDQPLTVAFIYAVQDYTIRAGGPPTPADLNDPRNLAPFPDAVTALIASGQSHGVFRSYPPAVDLGPNLTNLLLLRTFTRPNETADETAEFILTLAFGALAPKRLLDAGPAGRPFLRVSD